MMMMMMMAMMNTMTRMTVINMTMMMMTVRWRRRSRKELRLYPYIWHALVLSSTYDYAEHGDFRPPDMKQPDRAEEGAVWYRKRTRNA